MDHRHPMKYAAALLAAAAFSAFAQAPAPQSPAKPAPPAATPVVTPQLVQDTAHSLEAEWNQISGNFAQSALAHKSLQDRATMLQQQYIALSLAPANQARAESIHGEWTLAQSQAMQNWNQLMGAYLPKVEAFMRKLDATENALASKQGSFGDQAALRALDTTFAPLRNSAHRLYDQIVTAIAACK